MRIFRKQCSFLHSLLRRNFTLRSGTLLSVFLISMISLLSALTRPLAGAGARDLHTGHGDLTPIRGNILTIPSRDGLGNGTNVTRFEPKSQSKRIHARAAGVVYITKKELGQFYIEDNPKSAISQKDQAPGSKHGKTSRKTGSSKNITGHSVGLVKDEMSIRNSPHAMVKPKENISNKKNIPKSSTKVQSKLPPQSPRSINNSSNVPKGKVLMKTKTNSTKNSKTALDKTGVGKRNLGDPTLQESLPRTIQFYAQPPWLKNRDVQILRLLTEGVMQRRIGLSQNRSTEYLIYLENITEDGSRLVNNSVSVRLRAYADAVSLSCKEWQRVLAYHLDRIVGLNRVVPTAGRYVTELYSTTVKEGVTETAMWFPADLPARQHGLDSLEATRYVKKKFWRFSDRQKWSLTDDCAKNVEDERARMAVFLFILQIKEKQLQECFKYPANHSHAPKHQDIASRLSCRNTFWGSGMRLTGQTWCLPPLGVDVNDSNSFNYTMLESIQKFPSDVLKLIQSGKIRQHLLQSLFVDRIFWESQGARKGIEKILQVIDKRSKALSKWFNVKGYIQR